MISIDFSRAVRSTSILVVKLLNARLADAIDLSLQAKQAHWNVKGPHFIALHELFEKVAEHAEEHVDAMAVGLAQFGKAARAAIEIADDLDDEVTADLFNEITASTDKDLWFVEAHLQADE